LTTQGGPPWPNTGAERLASALALFGDGEPELPNVPQAVVRRLIPYFGIFHAIVFLREVGSSDEIRTKIEGLLGGATAALAPPRRDATANMWNERHAALEEHVGDELSEWGHAVSDAHTAHHHSADSLEVFVNAVSALASSLESQRQQAETYERELTGAGLVFQTATGHVRAKSGPRGGAPRSVFPEILEAVYDGLVEEGKDQEINGEMREAIAYVLGGFFPPKWLDTRPGGDLDNSLRNAIRPNRGGTAP
jgi:hypothetical protein